MRTIASGFPSRQQAMSIATKLADLYPRATVWVETRIPVKHGDMELHSIVAHADSTLLLKMEGCAAALVIPIMRNMDKTRKP